MVVMEPESSLRLSSSLPPAAVTDPRLLSDVALEFLLFTIDVLDEALRTLRWWCAEREEDIIEAGAMPKPRPCPDWSPRSTSDAIRLNVFVRSFTLTFSSTGGSDVGSWLEPRDSSVASGDSEADAVAERGGVEFSLLLSASLLLPPGDGVFAALLDGGCVGGIDDGSGGGGVCSFGGEGVVLVFAGAGGRPRC